MGKHGALAANRRLRPNPQGTYSELYQLLASVTPVSLSSRAAIQFTLFLLNISALLPAISLADIFPIFTLQELVLESEYVRILD